jgi:hypothetical protein
MSRQIPTDKPLNDEDRAYLLMRGDEARVNWFDTTYPADAEEADAADQDAEEDEEETPDLDDEEDDDEVDDPGYEEWSIADLKAEIEDRNKKAGDSPMSVTGVKADLAKRLREDDAAKE